MQLNPLQVAALDAVLRLGSFDAAAAELNVTQSAISQRIAALENRVGAPLVVRGTPARGTQIGLRLARHARELAVLEAALARDIGADGPSERLHIALNADSLDTWAIPALAASGFVFDITVADEAVSLEQLRDGRVSAAISAQPRPIQGGVCHPLGVMRYLPTCSPAFHDRYFAAGVDARTLAVAPMLDFSGHDRLQRDWLLRHAGRRLTPPTHHLPSTHGFVAATIAGMGWALNPHTLVAGHLDTGALVEVLPGAEMRVPLYWHLRSLMAPALRPVTRALQSAALRALDAMDAAA